MLPFASETVSVVIPVCNVSEQIIHELLSKLFSQTVAPCEVIVVDSSEGDELKPTCLSFENTIYKKIDKSSFNHGSTRDEAFRECNGDYILCMTQDALPKDDNLISSLLSAFMDKSVAVSFARQIPYNNAKLEECYVRAFNYPENSIVHTAADIDSLGIKAFFLSNVCAMYRRTTYFSMGGFEHDLLTNEDMFFACKTLHSGFSVAYVAEAQVFHSHNFSMMEQYRRNYIQGYELQRHADMLKGVSQNTEGWKMVKSVSRHLLSEGKLFECFSFVVECVFRYSGNCFGRMAAKK